MNTSQVKHPARLEIILIFLITIFGVSNIGHNFSNNSVEVERPTTSDNQEIREKPEKPRPNIQLSAFTSNTFVSTWDTTQTSSGSSSIDQVSLPLVSSGSYNFNVYWGDGFSDTITTWDQAESNHTYSTPGTYTIAINGTLEGWQFDYGGDRLKIQEISQWGEIRLGNSGAYFAGASNLVLTATDNLDLNGTTDLTGMFRSCTNLGDSGNMNGWNVSSVTTMKDMFNGATSFNQSIGNWDVSNVTNMEWMFYNAQSFNQPIGNWNVSAVTDMSNMFWSASTFNQPLGSWNVTGVTDMHSLFRLSAFNQQIGNWDVSNVESMSYMFWYATAFNQDISGWDVSGVYSMGNMFDNAASFDQPLGSWDISSVIAIQDMFSNIALSTENYDNLLEGWSQLSLTPALEFDGGNSKYTNTTARNYIIDTFGWTIIDGGYEGVDTTSPDLNSPADLTYEAGSTGNELTWNVGDINPDVYNVTKDGTIYVTDTAWTNDTITVNVDDLPPGTYTFTINIYDSAGNNAADSVLVTVEDTTSPELSTNGDISYEQGSTGNEIIWIVGDVNPDVYNVTKGVAIYVTDTGWSNDTITVNVDGLSLGTYTFTITIYDTEGNDATDSITVTVEDTSPPELSTNGDISYEEGSTGNEIIWNVVDLNPGFYNVTKDGATYMTDTAWSNGPITVNVDGLSPGTYSFAISIYDTESNEAAGTVIVTVNEVNDDGSSDSDMSDNSSDSSDPSDETDQEGETDPDDSKDGSQSDLDSTTIGFLLISISLLAIGRKITRSKI